MLNRSTKTIRPIRDGGKGGGGGGGRRRDEVVQFSCVALCPRMSVDILGTSGDQRRSMVQYSFTSTKTRRLVRTDSPGRPPRLSHSS